MNGPSKLKENLGVLPTPLARGALKQLNLSETSHMPSTVGAHSTIAHNTVSGVVQESNVESKLLSPQKLAAGIIMQSLENDFKSDSELSSRRSSRARRVSFDSSAEGITENAQICDAGTDSSSSLTKSHMVSPRRNITPSNSRPSSTDISNVTSGAGGPRSRVGFAVPPSEPPPQMGKPMPTAKTVNLSYPVEANDESEASDSEDESTVSAAQSEPSKPISLQINCKNIGHDDDDDDHDDDNEDQETQGNESGDDDDYENSKQVRALREHARVLQRIGDLQETEALLQRALALDPTDLKTLHYFAVFLHRKRGELSRAEAFFRRALQGTMAGLLSCLSTGNSPISAERNENALDSGRQLLSRPPAGDPGGSGTKLRISSVVLLLLDYSSFLCRARGDMDGSLTLCRRAVEVAPDDSMALATLAHLLADSATSGSGRKPKLNTKADTDRQQTIKEADELFARALKANPNNFKAIAWYAKLLRRTGRMGQAEVMYQAAIAKSQGGGSNPRNERMEPLALCNYASFVCKHRKDPERAFTMFRAALDKYPKHKGLLKNFGYLLKENPELRKRVPLASISVSALKPVVRGQNAHSGPQPLPVIRDNDEDVVE